MPHRSFVRAYKKDTFNPDYEVSQGFPCSDLIEPFPDFLKPVYVISIRRTRMDNFVTRMGPWMSYMRRINATNGNEINRALWIRQGKIRADCGMNKGQLGAAESHWKCWKEIGADTSRNHGVVFEDDFAIDFKNPEFITRFNTAMEELQTKNIEWNLLMLASGPTGLSGLVNVPGLNHWKTSMKCTGFIAYIIKRDFAAQLVKDAIPFQNPAIDMFVLFNYMKKRNLPWYVIYPILAGTVPVHSDTMHLRP